MYTTRKTTGTAQKNKNSRRLALIGSLALSIVLMLSFVACSGSSDNGDSSESSGTTGMPNPIVEVENPEAVNQQLGVNLNLPDGAKADNCSVIDKRVGSIDFTLDNKSYTYRAEATQGLEDISGLNYDFETSKEFETAGVVCVMNYNENGPGYCHWFDEVGKVTYSVSMDSGASEKALTEITESLIAKQRLM